MGDGNTTASVQQYLYDLAAAQGSSAAEPIVRSLLARAVRRLETPAADPAAKELVNESLAM